MATAIDDTFAADLLSGLDFGDDRPSRTWNYLPTPEQIAEECRLIRAGWSRDEELKRRARPYPAADVATGGICE